MHIHADDLRRSPSAKHFFVAPTLIRSSSAYLEGLAQSQDAMILARMIESSHDLGNDPCEVSRDTDLGMLQ